MNLLCDITNFHKDSIFFLDTKRNMVIEGKFTKLIYSDSSVALNGLYLYCPIQGHYGYGNNSGRIETPYLSQQQPNKMTFQFSLLDSWNIHLMKELTRIEHEIIEHYKEMFQIQKMNLYSLRNQMKLGNIKVVNTKREQGSEICNASRPIIIKISGVWETDFNVGITYKFQI